MYLTTINDNELDVHARIENVFIIGDWNNKKYMILRKQIDVVCDHCAMKMKTSCKLTFPGRRIRLYLMIVRFVFLRPILRTVSLDLRANGTESVSQIKKTMATTILMTMLLILL